MLDIGHDFRLGGSVALEFVRHQHTRGVALEQFSEETSCCLLVPPALHKDIKRIAVLIDRPPQIMVLASPRAGCLQRSALA